VPLPASTTVGTSVLAEDSLGASRVAGRQTKGSSGIDFLLGGANSGERAVISRMDTSKVLYTATFSVGASKSRQANVLVVSHGFQGVGIFHDQAQEVGTKDDLPVSPPWQTGHLSDTCSFVMACP